LFEVPTCSQMIRFVNLFCICSSLQKMIFFSSMFRTCGRFYSKWSTRTKKTKLHLSALTILITVKAFTSKNWIRASPHCPSKSRNTMSSMQRIALTWSKILIRTSSTLSILSHAFPWSNSRLIFYDSYINQCLLTKYTPKLRREIIDKLDC